MSEGSKTIEIRLAGFGGQGVILAGLIIGQAAVNESWFVAGSNSYGAQARGSACKADVVISSEPIDYPHVESPGLFVAMSQGGYDAFRDQVAEEGKIFYDSGLVTPSGVGPPERGLEVNAISINEFGNNQVANVIWVGIVSGAMGWFGPEAIERAAEQHVPNRFLELNRRALQKGLMLAPSWKDV